MRDTASERIWIVGAGAFVVLQLWFAMAATSLWLDETETWWIVKDGAENVVHRALTSSGQSPLYYFIAWAASRVFGLNEIALRIPSMLAMACAAYFVYRVAERVLDRAGAAAGAFLFVCAGSFYAVDARPYALALACLTGAVWLLLRWMDRYRPLDGVLYVLASALLIYAHPFLALSLAAVAGVAGFELRKEPRKLAWLAGLEAAVVLLSIPVLDQLRTMFATRTSHAMVVAHPATEDLLRGIVPCSVAGAVVIGVWLLMIFRGEAETPGIARRHAFLIGVWSLFAPVFLFLLAKTTSLWLYVPRYYLSALPAQAILVGGLLSSIRREGVRRALCAGVAAIAILMSGRLSGDSHGKENWRDAMALLRQEAGSTPVLLVSGFVEAADFKALDDFGKGPVFASDFFSPELLYGMPRRSIRLPNSIYSAERDRLEDIVRGLRDERRFYLVTENPDGTYQMWLLGAMSAVGRSCKAVTTGSRFGSLWVLRFDCE